ncbi:hypothetical protein C8F01DRAFT_980532, partial [Mycena amicta]
DHGWVLSQDGDLLFWLPPAYRHGFRMPLNSCVIAQHEVVLSYENFVHGKDWAHCYEPSA